MIFKPRTKIGVADISDLTRSKVVRWQHNNYLSLLLVMGLLFPMGVAGLGWGDWKGGFFFAGAARLLFVHHVSSRFHTCCCFTRLTAITFVVHLLCQLVGSLARRAHFRRQAHPS
jgi:fatty-acid desaturase